MMLIIRDYNKAKMVTHSKNQESSQKTLFIGNKPFDYTNSLIIGDLTGIFWKTALPSTVRFLCLVAQFS